MSCLLDQSGVGLIQLILAQEAQAPLLVQQLLARAKTEIANPLVVRGIIDWRC